MIEAPLANRWRLGLEVRQDMPAAQQAALIFAGLAAGLLIAALILASAGVGFGALYAEFVVSIFSSPQSLSAVLVQMAPLLIVVVRSGGSPPPDELLALFTGRVADWQRPVQALCFPEMPKLGNGDIDKRELRALVDTLF